MKLEWLTVNGYDEVKRFHKISKNTFHSSQNDTVDSMPVFEYYDFENYILCYYYPYMTLACQGGAFLTGVLYRCGKIKLFCIFNVTCFFVVSFLNYRYWNLLGTMMAGLCLPVDVLIFYKGFIDQTGVQGMLMYVCPSIHPSASASLSRLLYLHHYCSDLQASRGMLRSD